MISISGKTFASQREFEEVRINPVTWSHAFSRSSLMVKPSLLWALRSSTTSLVMSTSSWIYRPLTKALWFLLVIPREHFLHPIGQHLCYDFVQACCEANWCKTLTFRAPFTFGIKEMKLELIPMHIFPFLWNSSSIYIQSSFKLTILNTTLDNLSLSKITIAC